MNAIVDALNDPGSIALFAVLFLFIIFVLWPLTRNYVNRSDLGGTAKFIINTAILLFLFLVSAEVSFRFLGAVGLAVPYETINPIALFIGAALGLFAFVEYVIYPVTESLLSTSALDQHARKPILKVTYYLYLLFAVTVALGMAGFGNFLTSLATVFAAATLAIGFAMQSVIKNFVSGIFLLVEQPFRIGDWIEWDDFSGVVEDISLRVSRVRTFDNELLTVPNGDLTDTVVKNPVAKDRLRIKILFGIGYADDIREATEVILEEARNNEDILDEPEPSVRMVDLGDSAVGLQSRIWIQDPGRSDFVRTKSEYVTAVKYRFDEEGIEFPYPQRELSGEIVMKEPEVDSGDDESPVS